MHDGDMQLMAVDEMRKLNQQMMVYEDHVHGRRVRPSRGDEGQEH